MAICKDGAQEGRAFACVLNAVDFTPRGNGTVGFQGVTRGRFPLFEGQMLTPTKTPVTTISGDRVPDDPKNARRLAR
jgi:hypothetical protein